MNNKDLFDLIWFDLKKEAFQFMLKFDVVLCPQRPYGLSGTATSTFTQLPNSVSFILLYVHSDRTDCQGRPPRLSHSSWALKGSARSSLKGRERAVVSQTDIGTVSKATLEYFQETGWNAYGLSRALGHNSERERTELLSCAHRKAPLTDTEGFGLQTERLWIGTPVLFTLKVVFFLCVAETKNRGPMWSNSSHGSLIKTPTTNTALAKTIIWYRFN